MGRCGLANRQNPRTTVFGTTGWPMVPQGAKTPQSRRSVPLPPDVVEALGQYRVEQAQRKLKAGPNYHEYGFVFTSENGEPLHKRNLIRRHFKLILKAADLHEELRLYDLRHTCATLLLAARENPKIVSERLGHASINMTPNDTQPLLPCPPQHADERCGQAPTHAVSRPIKTACTQYAHKNHDKGRSPTSGQGLKIRAISTILWWAVTGSNR
ncbi:tyrosine-type recombinase/integrase [Alicyclobacillus kakegawensis]|uniref:tyrosine-type recombinase/integrase n=1 Tax=Alicyclobacillus kakegawensis TaxID=392012 RepID=UPI0009F9CA17